jgi:hypothetical protein
VVSFPLGVKTGRWGGHFFSGLLGPLQGSESRIFLFCGKFLFAEPFLQIPTLDKITEQDQIARVITQAKYVKSLTLLILPKSKIRGTSQATQEQRSLAHHFHRRC